MITHAMLEVYERYSGDIDGWARVGSSSEKSIITDEDWSDIDWLRMELSDLKKGQVSEDYAKEIMEKLKSKTADESIANELVLMMARIEEKRSRTRR